MIISCPECETKFAIADAVLGERGRKVRCFKCGHAWHQMPENAPPPNPAPSPEPAPRRAAPPLMPAMPTVGDSSLPLEADPFRSTPEPMPQPERSFDLPLDSADVSGREDDFEIPQISQPDDLSALATTAHADDEPGGYNAVDVDALLGSRAEDIPNVLSKRVHEEEKRSGFSRWLIVLVLIGGAFYGLWHERIQVVERFPATAPLYKALGAPLEILGEGLEFRGVGSEMIKEGRTSVLLVRGVIANVVKDTRAVPLLRLVLLDTGGGTIQEAFAKPRKDSLDAGQQMGFQIRMENPSAAAVRYEVTFAEAPANRAIEPAADAPPPAGQITPAPTPAPAPAPAAPTK